MFFWTRHRPPQSSRSAAHLVRQTNRKLLRPLRDGGTRDAQGLGEILDFAKEANCIGLLHMRKLAHLHVRLQHAND